jgi:GTP-binding protein HflX
LNRIDSNKSIKAAVVTPLIAGEKNPREGDSRLAEAVGLALAIHLDVLHSEVIKVKSVRPATFFGGGFIENLAAIIDSRQISLLVIDTSLSPIQQRNLEQRLKIKVIDRTALILEIFGERAQTREGKLQVELAHLTYQRSRLVRSWTHLERQRGGAGFLGGPGEKQIELDRRLIDEKIVRLKKDLEKVKKTRGLQRSKRQKVPYPLVVLVGYTNAGKSSLFNCLSGSNVFAENMLFATLDPTLRQIRLSNGREVILSDTVGFVSDLPHELVMAFRATLEEVAVADLIIHVCDASSPDFESQRNDVFDVLGHLGLNAPEIEQKYLEVMNKCDLIDPNHRQIISQKLENQNKKIIWTSALTGEGLDKLLLRIQEHFDRDSVETDVFVPAENGRMQSWLYNHADVLAVLETGDANRIGLRIRIQRVQMARFEALFGINIFK